MIKFVSRVRDTNDNTKPGQSGVNPLLLCSDFFISERNEGGWAEISRFLLTYVLRCAAAERADAVGGCKK